MSPNQAAWQREVLQIAADLMRMRWDERIPEDISEALCHKGLRLRDIVDEARS
jgi:hypothetical protein